MSQQIINGLAQQRIIRRKVVEDKTGLSRSSIYLFISKGKFPAPISLGAKAVGWVELDIAAHRGWMEGGGSMNIVTISHGKPIACRKSSRR